MWNYDFFWYSIFLTPRDPDKLVTQARQHIKKARTQLDKALQKLALAAEDYEEPDKYQLADAAEHFEEGDRILDKFLDVTL